MNNEEKETIKILVDKIVELETEKYKLEKESMLDTIDKLISDNDKYYKMLNEVRKRLEELNNDFIILGGIRKIDLEDLIKKIEVLV